MAKRVLIVPDVHGRTFWKEPVNKYIEQVDRIIFLGDYLDPYRDEGFEYTPESVYDNLMEIIRLKLDNQEKVVLLKGNHDQHYSSRLFYDLARGTRCDKLNWERYHEVFTTHKDLFQLACMVSVNGNPYVFTHAGLTIYWLNKVNSKVWKMSDNMVSVADQDIIDRINLLDDDGVGQRMLSVIGKSRSLFRGEKAGSVLWADIEEHPIQFVPKAYGLNKVFQVFGHTRLDSFLEDIVVTDNLVMVDSQKCFVIDERVDKRIINVFEYEKFLRDKG